MSFFDEKGHRTGPVQAHGIARSRSRFGYGHADPSPRGSTLLALLPPLPILPDTVDGSLVVLTSLVSLDAILRGSASMAPLAKSARFDRRPPKRLVCSAEKLSA